MRILIAILLTLLSFNSAQAMQYSRHIRSTTASGSGSGPGYKFIQLVTDSADGTWSVTLTPQATGHTIVFCSEANFSAQPTISNTSSYTWTKILTTGYFTGTGGSIGLQCWKAQATTTSAQTITMGGSGNGYHGHSVGVEYSGLAGTQGTQSSNSANVSSSPTVTISPTATGNLAFCFVQNTGASGTFLGGFTVRNTDAYLTQYIDGPSVSGSQTITGVAGPNPWGIICANIN